MFSLLYLRHSTILMLHDMTLVTNEDFAAPGVAMSENYTKIKSDMRQ